MTDPLTKGRRPGTRIMIGDGKASPRYWHREDELLKGMDIFKIN